MDQPTTSPDRPPLSSTDAPHPGPTTGGTTQGGGIDEIRASHDRLSGLLDAVVAVASELDLSSVLRHIVSLARSLVDAHYAALGVLGEADELREFVYDGISGADAERIGALPTGGGILGLLITDPRPLRLDVLGEHPDSCGFPPHHPPMTSFLGVPVLVRGQVFGNLYLTDKASGAAFTEEDEALVIALAAAAGVAIDNARLYERAVLQQEWLEASAEITGRMLGGATSAELLALIAHTAHELAGADESGVRTPDAERQELVLTAAGGERSRSAIGERLPMAGTLLGDLFESGGTADEHDLSLTRPDDPLVVTRGVGPVLAIALKAGDQVLGTLSLSRYIGRPPFDPDVVPLVESFGSQAALALAYTQARADSERLLLFSDRDRIARDLHDVVIQRIFAAGLALQAVGSLLPPGDVSTRLGKVVDELDDTIRDLRTSIFALQHEHAAPEGLRLRLVDLVNRSAEGLGFAPRLRISGEIETRLGPEAAEHLYAALNEALANVVRHAGANEVDVLIEVGDDLVLTVADDGKGYAGQTDRRSGLGNLWERAEASGGHLELGESDLGGALLRWSVPLVP
jgi:signal transduction histidine kinase